MTTKSESTLTGAAFDLANAGYTPMPNPERDEEGEAIGSDSSSLREAAGERSVPQDDIVVRQYTDGSGKQASWAEAVTLARAARDYASVTAMERAVKESESSKSLAARVDAMRADVAAKDPQAPEFYGFEPPAAAPCQAEKDSGDQPKQSAGHEQASSQLDPDLEKLMQHPQVRLALEEKVGEVDRARQSYVEGLNVALQVAQTSFVSQFPELAGLPAAQLPTALAQMAQQDPAKFSRVQAIIEGSEQLLARRQQETRRQQEAGRHHFQAYARGEDSRLETMLKGEPVEVRQAVAQEITASAKAGGIQPDELHRLFESEPLMRNATFQHMMYDAAKYRLMIKAKDAVAARPLPPVQRPGMAGSRGERERSDLHALNAKLSGSGDLKDAVALYQARRAGRR